MQSHQEAQSALARSASVADMLALPAALLCGAALAVAMVRILTSHVGHDQSWGLYLALQILHGVRLNGDRLVEVNPPFIVWFMSLPVLLSRALHLDLLNGFRCFYMAILAGSGLWAALLFRRLFRSSALAFWLFALIACCVGIFPYALDDLGQREHLVSFLLLPYLLAAAFRIQRERLSGLESCLIGLVAAVAICLKPQHLLEIVLIEAVVLYRLRSLRGWFHGAVCALALGLIAYFVAVRLIAPAYLTDVVPLLTATYWGFDQPLRIVIRVARKPIVILLLDLLLYTVLRKRLRIEALASVLLVSTIGALLAYLQQHKGWSYQIICLQFFGYLLLFLICADVLERSIDGYNFALTQPIRPIYAPVAAVFSLVVGLGILLHHPRTVGYTNDEKQTLAEVYGAYPRGTTVGLLSLDPWEFPAVVEQDKIWGSRYMHLWLLPAIIRSQDPEDEDVRHHLSPQQVNRLSTLLRTTTAQDLAYWQPQVVAVDPCGMIQICIPLRREHYGDLINWFAIEPQFREQWSHYAFQRSIGRLEVYTRTP